MKKITLLSFIIFTITLQGQNKLLSSIEEFFDGTNWNYTSGSNYEYDSNNNLISETQLLWNSGASKWENSAKIIYTYNMSNMVTNELFQDWNTMNNMFEDSSQSIYTYVSGNITEYLDQNWDTGVWKNDYKSTFGYTGGLIDEALTYEWNGTQWIAEERSTVTYNGNNRFDKIVIDDWDGSNWITSERQVFTYDGSNRLTVDVYELWNGSSWVEDENTVYTLDANSNRTKEVNTYDGSTYENTYVYDTNFLMSSFAHPFKDKTGLDYIVEDNPYYNKLLSTTSDDVFRTTYDYNSALVLGTEDFKIVNSKLKVFPNPTLGRITIKSSKSVIKNVEIYNAIGRKVFSTKANHFNINNLDAGVYFLKMTSNGGAVYTRKIVRK